MARIRTIKPDFWKHEDLSELPEATHMLAAALLNYADDEGYFNANHKLITAELFPLREPSVSIHCSLTHLSNIGYLRLGKGDDGKTYGHIINFNEHQRVNRPIASKIKGLRIVWEDSVRTHTQLSEDSPLEWKGKEGKEEGKGKGKEDTQQQHTTPPREKSENEKPRAAAKPDPAIDIIAALDDVLAQTFGQPRPNPAGDDIAYARRWIEDGLSKAHVRDVMLGTCMKRKAKGQPSPSSLKFFDGFIRDKPPEVENETAYDFQKFVAAGGI